MSLPSVPPAGASTAPAAPTTPAERQPHVVKRPGETLNRIAERYNITLDELLAVNPQFDKSKLRARMPDRREGEKDRNPNLIHPGEEIRIPALRTAPATTVATPAGADRERDGVEKRHTPAPAVVPPTTAEKALEPAQQTAARAPSQAAQPPAAAGAAPSTDTPGAGAQPTGEAKPKEKATGGFLGFLSKLFSNEIFQGILAVLSAIPGLGQVVSAIGAVINFTRFMVGASAGKPDWTLFSSSLLFLAGAFAPGVGAFGGLLGMVAALDAKAQPSGRAEGAATQEARKAEKKGEAAQAMTTAEITEASAALARVRPPLDALRAEPAPEGWNRDMAAVHAAYERQKALPDAQQKRDLLAGLTTYFSKELPEALMTRGLELAYGTQMKTPPAPGSLLPAGQVQRLADVAREAVAKSEPSGDPARPALPALSEAEMLAAIRAYNGLPADATATSEGMPLYIPTADRVRAYAGNNKSLYFTDNGHEPFRTRGLAVLGTITGSPLAAEILRVWGVIQKMNVVAKEILTRRGVSRQDYALA